MQITMTNSDEFYSYFSLYRICIVLCNFIFVHGIGESHCSFNLVTGPYGVPDDHLSASSTWRNREEKMPKHGRLHSATGWVSSSNGDEYIQVDFDIDNMILAVKTQGRNDGNEHVRSYAVAYSTDNAKWTFVKDNNVEKIFSGNFDRNTVVTNELSEVVIAKHFRIHPRVSYGSYFGLRFELIGCRVLVNSWKVHPISVTDLQGGLWSKSAADLGKCATLCYHRTSCESFVFNSDTCTCTGFEQEFLYGYRLDVLRGNLYFLRTLTLNKHEYHLKEQGFTSASNAIYKIYTDKVNVISATRVCQSHNTSLLAVRNLEMLNMLQKEIKNNPAIDSKPYVRGSQLNGKWVYQNDIDIPVTLWSDGEPNSIIGGCVVVSLKGLMVKDCTWIRPFICGF